MKLWAPFLRWWANHNDQSLVIIYAAVMGISLVALLATLAVMSNTR